MANYIVHLLLLPFVVLPCEGFIRPLPTTNRLIFLSKPSLSLFRDGDDGPDGPVSSNGVPMSAEAEDVEDEASNDDKSILSFLPRFLGRTKEQTEPDDSTPPGSSPSVEHEAATSTATEEHQEMSPIEKAKALQAQAEKTRLEAERMDAELILEKIERLISRISEAKAQNKPLDDFSQQLEQLRRKLRGEEPVSTNVVSNASASRTETDIGSVVESEDVAFERSATTLENDRGISVRISRDVYEDFDSGPPGRGLNVLSKPFNETRFHLFKEEAAQAIDSYSGWGLLRGFSGLTKAESSNSTQLALIMEARYRGDYSWLENVPRPDITKELIEKTKQKLQNPLIAATRKFERNVTRCYDFDEWTDEDELAKLEIVTTYYGEILTRAELATKNPPALLKASYPRYLSERQFPTEEQAKAVLELLPDAGFVPLRKKPILTSSGWYAIPGNINSSAEQAGDTFIEAIDDLISQSDLLKENVTISVRTIRFLELELQTEDDDSSDHVVIVFGANVTPPRPSWTSTAVSALGLLTCWYAAAYPLLLNTGISDQVQEQLTLANSGMEANLDFLTDLSQQWLSTFLGCQLLHEVGHSIAAGAYNISRGVPTLVPSLATGLTSTITPLKTPPKNVVALYDFGAAGPLLGMIASIVALYVGCTLTKAADPTVLASFPQLPIQILQQSALARGIIESVFGPGVLSLPAGLETSQLTALTFQLHPIAIAGFMSMLVNGFALLPIGSSDGGRMALASFGRTAVCALGRIALAILLFKGFLGGNDLFLTYAGFLCFFQGGDIPDLPVRNEVDLLPIPRVVLNIATISLAILVLSPLTN